MLDGNTKADDGAPFIVAGMPMYNEEETIGTVVTLALKYADAVICVDDDLQIQAPESLKLVGQQ